MNFNYNLFLEQVKKHLGDNYNPNKAGWYNYKGKFVSHSHILYLSEDCKSDIPLRSKEQIRVVKEQNLLESSSKLPFLYEFSNIKLHPDAHHLNSSQIMCYNFFRPLMSESVPSKRLLSLFQYWCPNLVFSNDTECSFEYIKDNKEKTNYDFFIRSGECHIYCEIKYTEGDFSKCTSAGDSKEERDKMYQQRMKQYPNIWQENVPTAEYFTRNHYQLFRNALSVESKNDYVFFICPACREDLRQSYNEFAKYLSEEGRSHIIFLPWESLLEKVHDHPDYNEFIKKYLSF